MTLHTYLIISTLALVLGNLMIKLTSGEVLLKWFLLVLVCSAIPYMNFGVMFVSFVFILLYAGWVSVLWIEKNCADLLDKKLF